MREIICARSLKESRRKSARVMKGSLGASERGAPKQTSFCGAYRGESRTNFGSQRMHIRANFQYKKMPYGVAWVQQGATRWLAPRHYNTFISTCQQVKMHKKNDHFWSFLINYPFFCLVSIKSNLKTLPFSVIFNNLLSFSMQIS